MQFERCNEVTLQLLADTERSRPKLGTIRFVANTSTEISVTKKTEFDTAKRVIRIRTLVARLGICRSTIYSRLSKSSPYHDPSFPRPVKLGANSVGWFEDEVDCWLSSRAELRGREVRS